MSLRIAWESTAVDRTEEAAVKLVHQALARLEGEAKALWLFGSQEYDLASMLPPIQVLLGDIPVWGMTLYRIWDEEGLPSRMLGVAVLGGEEVEGEAEWYPTLSEAEAQGRPVTEPDAVTLLGIDAYTPHLPRWMNWLSNFSGALYGTMMGGTLTLGRTQLCAGGRGGLGGVARMTLRGVRHAAAWGTGWAPSGLLVEVTESRGERVYRLDGQLATERLAEVFGRSPRQWSYPPLRELARLYPLAVESKETWSWHAPLEVETDGSLRMTLPLRRGRTAHVMVGSAAECLEQARQAAERARAALGTAPQAGLLFVDWAWAHLFWARPRAVYRAVQEVLGSEIPLLGGYAAGPLVRPAEETSAPQVLDNHLLLVLWA